MRILSFFFGIILLSLSVYAEAGKRKKQAPKVSEPSLWTKQEILTFYQSWIVDELQFPDNLEIQQVPLKQEEPPKKEVSLPTKIQFSTESKENPFLHFFSENLKLILIGIAILSFALYRLRYGSSSYKSSGKTFSKFKDK
ncbi:MAG: hypothetical protein N3A69_04875 [Leptospiraceae bacterium]|nr:hypothetical protein [Leptospiraceae bacterium]